MGTLARILHRELHLQNPAAREFRPEPAGNDGLLREPGDAAGPRRDAARSPGLRAAADPPRCWCALSAADRTRRDAARFQFRAVRDDAERALDPVSVRSS